MDDELSKLRAEIEGLKRRLDELAYRRPDERRPRAALHRGPVRLVGPTASGTGLTCFSRFQLTVDGTDLDTRSVQPRARSLLRLLALHAGEPIHRERITAALWPTLDGATAMHNLHVRMSMLRRLLRPTADRVVIVRDGDSYTLVLEADAQVDVRVFERSRLAGLRARAAGDLEISAGALQAALDSYTGELLPEESAADWAVEARERYRAQAVDAAGALAEVQLARRDASAAVAAARWGVRIDGCHDASWRALVEALQLRGDLASADRARREYGAMLRSLGVDASGDTLRRGA